MGMGSPETAAGLMTPTGRASAGGGMSAPVSSPRTRRATHDRSFEFFFGSVRARQERPMNWSFIAAVALGGAVGSVARYLVGIGSGKLFGLGFPWGTLIINITGSFLIGVFVESFALRWNPGQAVRIFLTVGICGGYTTFSTFSLDSFLLIDRGEY